MSTFTPYPYPNITGIVDLYKYPDVLIGGMWGPLLIGVFWLILLSWVNSWERITNFNQALIASSFTVGLVSIILASLEIITPYITVFPMLITGVSAFLLHIDKDK